MNSKQDKIQDSVKATVARIKSNRKRIESAIKFGRVEEDNINAGFSELKEKTNISLERTRVSKKSRPVRALDRKGMINAIIKRLLIGELTQGAALKELRVNVLGLKQDSYAKLVDVSRKTLSDVENDRGSYKTEILDKLFKPFGLKVGLVPVSPGMLKSLLKDTFNES